MFDCINIFEVFLPQLLRYPNPTDPLNGEAAALLLRDSKAFDTKAREYVSMYATQHVLDGANGAAEEDEHGDEDEEMSEIGSVSSEDPADGLEM